MDRGDLSTKTVLITASIWLGIFFLFTCTAVTLAVTSNPLFSLLIMVGTLPSTLAAYFYAAESRHNPAVPCDPLNVQELQVVPRGKSRSGPSSVSLRGSSLSEPCLCTGPVLTLRRSSSCPWMAPYSAPNVVRQGAPIQIEVVTPSDQGRQQSHDSIDDGRGLTAPFAAAKESRDDIKEMPTVKSSETERSQGKDDGTDAVSATSTESESESPDAFWNDVVSDRRRVDSRSSQKSVGTTPLLSSSPSSSGSSVPDNCHYLLFCEDYEQAVVLDSTPPSRSAEDATASIVGGPERQPSDEGFLEIQQRTQVASRQIQTTVATPSREVTKNSAGQASQLARTESFDVVEVRDEESYAMDAVSRPKKSKRKLKLIPRFLKGKKKEFVRLK